MTKMKKIRMAGMLLINAVFFSSTTEAQQETKQQINQFSLQQAIDYAKKNSVQVKNALLDVLIQKQTNRDVTSIALPQINGSAGINDYLDIPTTLLPGEIVGQPPGTFVPVKFGTKWNSSASISVTQLLFDGQVFIALKARNGTMDLQRKIADLTEENIRANIYKIYYQLVVSKTQIQLLDANINRAEKLKHDVQVMYDNGFAEKVDVDKITVVLANLQTEKLKANNLIENGYAGLKVLMGMPVKDSLVLTDTLSDNQIREGVLEAAQYKYSDRNDYKVADITNKLNALNLRRYRLSQIPTFALAGNYSKQAQRNTFDFFGKGDWFTTSYIGIQMSVPIFHGFSTRAKIQQAKLQLQKSQNNSEALKNSIDREVDIAKREFISAIATMDFQKKNMALAELVYNQTKKKYEIGTGDATTINAAQVELKTAQTNYLSALYDAIIAKVDFLKATGKL